MNTSMNAVIRRKLMHEALNHVDSLGWSDDCFMKAIEGANVDPEHACGACPRRGVDLAVEFHRCGDDRMAELLGKSNLSAHRYSDRVAMAVWFRLEVDANHKYAARSCAGLFATPFFSAEGARLVWGTVDRIWAALGDESDDLNWYSKRAILSVVLGSSVLYWLGDESEGNAETQQFIERRIENVMQFEKLKSTLRNNPLSKPFMAGFSQFERKVKAPSDRRENHPGHMSESEAHT